MKTNSTDPSRRDFIKTAALSVGAAGTLAACGNAGAPVDVVADDSAATAGDGLPITVAGYPYDRVKGVADGSVPIEGCSVTFEVGRIGDLNTHIFSGPRTNAVTEIGLQPFMRAYAEDDFRAYTLLPVFPLKLFRHKSVFIRTDRGIKKAEDLRGRIIATPGYASTSLTWLRGLFQDEYGISPNDVEWVIASKDSDERSGKTSAQEQVLPEGLEIRRGPHGMDESELLVSGEVDALFHAAEPQAFRDGNPIVARLFPDYWREESEYFAKTGIHPIMHAVALRNELIDANPWFAEAVFNAYSQAKTEVYQYLLNSAWYQGSLPWIEREIGLTRELMGDNFYSYGIKGNRAALEALFRYSYEQGLVSRELTIEELFHPASLNFSEEV